MAFQSVPDVAQISIIYSMNGAIMENTFYAHHPGGYSLANLEALAADIDTAVDVVWLARQTLDCTYLRTEVRGLDEENDLVATDATNTGPGTATQGGFPNQVTYAIKKVSGKTGRSARGRTYWIGIPQDKSQAANESLIEEAYRDFIVAAVDVIRTNIASVGTWEAVLVSRFADGVKRDEGVTFPWIGTTFVDDVFDTQRGRLPN